MRNPSWVRDEIILALNLYFQNGRKQLPAHHLAVLELSKVLNEFPIHPLSRRTPDFRNPNGISMILGNLFGIDPSHPQSGLTRNNHLQQEVWNDFAGDPGLLARTANAIRHCLATEQAPDGFEEQLVEEECFREGAVLSKLHKARERSAAAIERKKSAVLAATGQLLCEVCDFDFEKVYGELGREFAECHHILPLAEGVYDRTTRLTDLAIVCANCHRMLHRSLAGLSISGLRAVVVERRRIEQFA